MTPSRPLPGFSVISLTVPSPSRYRLLQLYPGAASDIPITFYSFSVRPALVPCRRSERMCPHELPSRTVLPGVPCQERLGESEPDQGMYVVLGFWVALVHLAHPAALRLHEPRMDRSTAV